MLFAKITGVNLFSYTAAAEIVREQALSLPSRPNRTEILSLTSNLSQLLGRVLAVQVLADRDQPPFNRSTRDGFACLAADITQGSTLKIAGRIRAGEIWAGPRIASGQAVEIMTGAPVPEGADCVLMIEHAVVSGDALTAQPGKRLAAGENIVPIGSEAAQGSVVVAPGTVLGPHHLATAASCGYEELEVFLRPRVAIVSTGDELVSISETPLPHQIRNSNSYSMAALVLQHGGEPVIFPVVRDSLESTMHVIRCVLESDIDLLLLSGGVSMGKYDFVEEALAEFGAEFFFTGARIQPGKPVVFGRIPGAMYFFGLPGNPLSAITTFTLFAAPLLAGLAGRRETGPQFLEARLGKAIQPKKDLTRFMLAFIESSANGATVRTISNQGSGDLAAISRANALTLIPEGESPWPEGTTVSVLML
ncbi:molybdopterin molybdotransferase MoeA [Silvibacterium acidisoli]|uniref:molybdopterin molybdotransferase MoeA n=1 Tax=Acidobacteriaceae bacterium ZG23-2 TaxID=2883246 RepID=UPI00406D3DC7